MQWFPSNPQISSVLYWGFDIQCDSQLHWGKVWDLVLPVGTKAIFEVSQFLLWSRNSFGFFFFLPSFKGSIYYDQNGVTARAKLPFLHNKSNGLIGMKLIAQWTSPPCSTYSPYVLQGGLVNFGHSRSFTVELRNKFELFTQNLFIYMQVNLLRRVDVFKGMNPFSFNDLINVTTGMTHNSKISWLPLTFQFIWVVNTVASELLVHLQAERSYTLFFYLLEYVNVKLTFIQNFWAFVFFFVRQ